jgi:uncharacterized lipoprotein NlpE involved in copper resistance
MKQLLKNAKAIVTILILTICFIGCDNGDDNLPTITAGFTHTINPYTGTVHLLIHLGCEILLVDFGTERPLKISIP